MPDTNERLFMGEKKKYFQHFWHHISEKKARQMQGCGEGHKNEGGGGGNRIKEREQRSRCGNSGQTVGNATEKF